MSYVCPVCGVLAADGEDLANHLAVTGVLHENDHAAWLDDRVDEWETRDPPTLAAAIVEDVEETDREPPAREGIAESMSPGRSPELPRDGPAATDAEVAEVIEEARGLTRRMRSGGGVDGGQDDSTSADDEAQDE